MSEGEGDFYSGREHGMRPLERYRKRTALAGYLSDGYKTHESRET